MSVRAAWRNARRATNYGLPLPVDDSYSRVAPPGAVFLAQQPSPGAQRKLANLLSVGERLQEQEDGREATDNDREQ